MSQNKPDHCHKETLLQLRAEARTTIIAEPGAAKAIKSWKYFDPNRVHALAKFNEKKRFGNSFRLPIAPLSPQGHAGEICVSFIPAKNYLTGLHNAFGITYIAPTAHQSIATVSTIDLPRRKHAQLPSSPVTLPPATPRLHSSHYQQRAVSLDEPRRTQGHRPQLSRSSNTASSEFLPLSEQTHFSSNMLDGSNGGDYERPKQVISKQKSEPLLLKDIDFDFGIDLPDYNFSIIEALPTPPDSPNTFNSHPPSVFSHTARSPHSKQQSVSTIASQQSVASITPARPKPVSIIYSPHGLPFDDLEPYIRSHLVKIGALPLTVLLHSFDHAQNPWYFGGNIMAGVGGGVKIAQALMARTWLSAHDENKIDLGISVRQLKVKRSQAEEVRKALWTGDDGIWLRQKGWTCDVRSLDVGKEMTIGQTRDLLSGMEGKRESRLLKFGIG